MLGFLVGFAMVVAGIVGLTIKSYFGGQTLVSILLIVFGSIPLIFSVLLIFGVIAAFLVSFKD